MGRPSVEETPETPTRPAPPAGSSRPPLARRPIGEAIKMAREHGDLRVEFELYYCLMQVWVKKEHGNTRDACSL